MEISGEVFAADMSRLSSAYHAADRAFQVPRCTDPEVIRIASQKDRTHAWLTENKLPTVRQGTVDQVLSHPDD